MKKTFSIHDSEVEIIQHLKSQYNTSRYICELIRKDIEEQKAEAKAKTENEDLLEQIKLLIQSGAVSSAQLSQREVVSSAEEKRNKMRGIFNKDE